MKRLICCFDGTWNDDRNEDELSNVVKLHRAIPTIAPFGIVQVPAYVKGIATDYEGGLKFGMGSLGLEVDDRIRAGYQILCASYEPGDEVYLFGFSRGAFQARSLAGFVSLFGIARQGAGFDLADAWHVYRNRGSAAVEGALARLRAASHYPARIRCIGVWDTVGNLGNPFSSEGRIAGHFKFHDTRLSELVDVGLHALSIDEQRGPFRPALWTLPEGGALPRHQHVEQVWFAGTHADVGGGFKETGLSDIGLLWMAERAAALTGLAVDLASLKASTRPDPLAAQHSSTTGRIFRWSARLPHVRLVRQEQDGIAPLRRALLGTWRTSRVAPGETVVNESVHDSVLTRFGRTVAEIGEEGRQRELVYRPRNLAAALSSRGGPAAREAAGRSIA